MATSNLLTQSVGNKQVNTRHHPNPTRNCIYRLITCFKVIVVVSYQKEIEDRQQESRECDQIGCQPSWKILNASVPKRMHHMIAEPTFVNRVVLQIKKNTYK